MKWLLILSNLVFLKVLGQIDIMVIDQRDQTPVPYVNISVKNSHIGYTTDEHGIFKLDTAQGKPTLVVYAVGYELLECNADTIKETIVLKPKTSLLHQIDVFPKNSKTQTIDEIKKQIIKTPSFTFSNSGVPAIIAKAFAFKEDNAETPFIESVSFRTISHLENVIFQVHIYDLDDSGQPFNELIEELILVNPKKGNHITQVDLSNYRIRVPSTGIAVGVEWLLIEQNKNDRAGKINYEPDFSFHETQGLSWNFVLGQWFPMDPFHHNGDKNRALNCQLVLTN